ncbi:hypothetical protein Rsub_10631 [Raphidocelis subcapitata]|uniref:Uncharacterized protein n=1 Tax=Raphidocelis subcapitata TaxID=307507 RepID=A0A2V0PDN2_9CHLO|nr:hypothetical protein Rsub_10631 [Raphidocelis subcapitata]|eukprot:GBF97958.1 hypothetical protein Rsub_10631 [Raphidocelis subcapitata]
MSSPARGDVGSPEALAAVLKNLCRGGRAGVRDALEAFTEGAVLRSALFQVRGRDRLFGFFRAWQAAFDDHLEVLDVAVHGNKALARVRHNLQPRVLNATVPGVGGLPLWFKRLATFPFIVSAEFTLEDTPRGRRISRWEEDISVYSLIYSLPLAERLWGSVVEPATGAIVASAGAAFDGLAPSVDKRLRDATGWHPGLGDI